jgi:hypothetical protein
LVGEDADWAWPALAAIIEYVEEIVGSEEP